MRGPVGMKTGKVALGAVLVVAVAAVGVLAAAGGAAATSGAVDASPASSVGAHLGAIPASGSIVVVHRGGGRDWLWSVDPITKSATQLIGLPLLYRPNRVEASPDARRLAYLSTTLTPGPTVTVYDTQTGALSTWSLAARGVKWVDSLAWVSNTKLLVTGRATRTRYPFADRVYQLNAVTGASLRFAGLWGTETTVAPAGAHPGRLVFVRFIDGGPVLSRPHWHWVIERLYRLTLATGAKPHLIGSVKYTTGSNIRYYQDPRLSPDGVYLVTVDNGGTNPIERCTVRWAATGKALKTVDTLGGGDALPTWSGQDDQVAFVVTLPGDSTRSPILFIYTASTRALHHSAMLDSLGVTSLGWSSNTSLAYSLRGLADDDGELWMVDPASLSSPTDLGVGSLPVFMH